MASIMRRAGVLLALCVGILGISSHSAAAVTLPRVLSSHMVLQREMAVPIWGSADPGETVTVTFRDQKKVATADAKGQWSVKLDALKVGPAATLTVAGSNTIALTDVLVGEVWVGSGQSNMDTDVQDYTQNDEPLRKAVEKNYPQLRMYRSDDKDHQWQEATPDSARHFSAQLFYFGMMLNKGLDVPVGVMEGAVRGSPSANWIRDDVVKSDPGIQEAIASYEKWHPYGPIEKRYQEDLAKWEKVTADLPADKKPGKPWREPKAGETRGGRGDFYDQHIRPMQPFAIRGVLWDQGEGGTNIHGISQDVVMHALIASWRKDWGQGDFAFIFVQKPTGVGAALDLQNPINKGAEAVAPLPKDAPQSYWDGTARLEYIRIMENPNTFMAISQDLGRNPDPHPANKSGFATRDSLVALGGVYGKKVEYYGPMYKACKVEGNTLRLTFTHVGQGLTVPKGQKLQGFEIAGEDKHFFWADAKIDGETVVLSSPSVAKPVAARYAWAWAIPWADLFNRDGLPSITFRTDNWW